MRILYIYINAPLKNASIKTKIISQIHYLNEAGANCHGVFFSKEITEKQVLNDHITYAPVQSSEKKLFRKLHQQKLMLEAVEEYLTVKYPDYDLIYFRYTLANSAMNRIMRKFGDKICLEHNSKEILEIVKQTSKFKKIWKLSSLLSLLAYVVIPLLRELTYGVLIRRRALMSTCVSNEMARYQRKHALGGHKVVPISNGIDLNANTLRTPPLYDGKRLNILFLKGTSGVAPRNGIDRLILSMEKYAGPVDVHLYIAGTNSEGEFEVPETLKNKVHIQGYLVDSELEQLFDQSHIAAATLALFRQGEHENAVLKTRMYVARGIPFIYAYQDVDLYQVAEAEYWSLELPNNNTLINMEEIIAFAEKALQPDHQYRMRKFAESCLGYNVQMKRLEAVLAQAINA